APSRALQRVVRCQRAAHVISSVRRVHGASPAMLLFAGRRSGARGGGAGNGSDLVGEVDLAVILRTVPDLPPGVGDAPKPVGVPTDAVDDQEGDTVLIRNVLGLDHPDCL